MKTLELHYIIGWSSLWYCVLLSFCSMECGFLLAVLQWWLEISNSLPKHSIAVFHLIVRYNTDVPINLNLFFTGMSDCNKLTPFNVDVRAVFRLLTEKNAFSNVLKLCRERKNTGNSTVISLLLPAASVRAGSLSLARKRSSGIESGEGSFAARFRVCSCTACACALLWACSQVSCCCQSRQRVLSWSEPKDNLRRISVGAWLLRHSFGSYGNRWWLFNAMGWQ